MKLKLTSAVCQIVDVGMYESFLDPRHMFDGDDYEIEHSTLITDDEKTYYFEKAFTEFNSDKYDSVVAKYAREFIETFFDDIEDVIKIELLEGGEISSPREYNFYTDSLLFDIDIEENELNKILPAVIADKHFWEWAAKYKSCSGFISFMPWEPFDYIDAISGKDIERAVSMYLTYLYEKENDENSSNRLLCERISENHSMADFINDKKALEIYNKVFS